MRNKVSSKEAIINTASEIIKNSGLEDCTARNISKEASVAVGTIYNYFDSRFDLLEHVFVSSWTKTKTKIEQIKSQDIPLRERVLKTLEAIGEDINARNGLGSYLIDNTNQKIENIHNKYPIFLDVISVVSDLIKEDPLNKELSKEALEINSLWIVFGLMSFTKHTNDMSIYYDQVILRFLSN